MKKLLLIGALTGAMAGILAGCAAVSTKGGAVGCPAAGFLTAADRSIFTAGGADYKAAMTGLTNSCRYKDGHMQVTGQFHIVVKPEAGAKTDLPGVQVPYIAAIIGPDDQIVSRRQLTAAIPLDETGGGADPQKLEQAFALETPADARHYKVIYAFPEE